MESDPWTIRLRRGHERAWQMYGTDITPHSRRHKDSEADTHPRAANKSNLTGDRPKPRGARQDSAYLLASAANIGWRLVLALHQSAWNMTSQATFFPDPSADLTTDWNSPAWSFSTCGGRAKRGACSNSDMPMGKDREHRFAHERITY